MNTHQWRKYGNVQAENYVVCSSFGLKYFLFSYQPSHPEPSSSSISITTPFPSICIFLPFLLLLSESLSPPRLFFSSFINSSFFSINLAPFSFLAIYSMSTAILLSFHIELISYLRCHSVVLSTNPSVSSLIALQEWRRLCQSLICNNAVSGIIRMQIGGKGTRMHSMKQASIKKNI
ncbi:unnamed protein product [Acanthosepion pharaonis]|uniref:Uncharacterized protein n=1 Tax=Acanthosepion pharaonis TaxID=158019 RepID=A0A812BYZ5_ACAPH|nr:unnamed protein product [Sepia pharaonis]